jgi:hypothetical protein
VSALIVKWRGYAVHFHINLVGRVWAVVKDSEATRFNNESEAHQTAEQHGLAWADITIEPAPAIPQAQAS